MGVSTQYDEYSSGRDAVFKFMDQNPKATLRSMIEFLCKKTLFGDLKHQTIKNYMSQWRYEYSRNGRVPRLHFGLGRLDSGFDAGLWESAPCYGWKISRNKNRERLWFESGITLCWHGNGSVVFRFKGSMRQGYLLAVFVHAFFGVHLSTGKSEREVVDFLQAIFKERYHQIARHLTYETGQPLPGTVIDRRSSHGELIKLGDGSHPTKVEIEETDMEPLWARTSLAKLSSVTENLAGTVEKLDGSLARNWDSHLKLVKTLTTESEKRQEVFERIAGPLPVKGFDDASIREIKQIALPSGGWCSRCGQNKVLYFSVHSIDSQGHGFDGAICRDCIRALREKVPLRLRKILGRAIGQRKLGGAHS